VAGLEAGADDFIRKPWAQAELRARLGVGNRMLLLHQQLEEHSRELLRASQIDPLTQILNRGTVIGRFEAELRRAKREQHPLTVLMIDVDHFKAINDTHGHAMGDEVLMAVAYHLESACRVYDIVGRYGGEEFLAVIPSACREEAEHVAERLREAVARARVTLHGQTVSVTASIGGAWLSAARDCDGDDLLKRADEKLYEAKENGRNRLEMTVFEG
jgi:two-component system chemotaxis response regulator CheY